MADDERTPQERERDAAWEAAFTRFLGGVWFDRYTQVVPRPSTPEELAEALEKLLDAHDKACFSLYCFNP